MISLTGYFLLKNHDAFYDDEAFLSGVGIHSPRIPRQRPRQTHAQRRNEITRPIPR